MQRDNNLRNWQAALQQEHKQERKAGAVAPNFVCLFFLYVSNSIIRSGMEDLGLAEAQGLGLATQQPSLHLLASDFSADSVHTNDGEHHM